MIHIPGFTQVRKIFETALHNFYQALEADQCVLLKMARDPSPLGQAALQQEVALISQGRFEWAPFGQVRSLGEGLVLVGEDRGGSSLLDRIGGGLALDTFLDWAIQLTHILAELHQAGWMLNQLGPELFWVSSEQRLTCFGLDQVLPLGTGTQQRRPSPEVGETYPYRSPEQLGLTDQRLDFRSDFYGLGVTFYQMLTGALPFAERLPSKHTAEVLTREPIPNAKIPAPLALLLNKLLAVAPRARYQNALGLKADLCRLQEQLGRTGTLEVFPLGQNDFMAELRFNGQLIERMEELDLLTQALYRSWEGNKETMFLYGPSGIGKSRLIQALEKPALARQTCFVCGQFDPIAQSPSHNALAQVLNQLCFRLLREESSRFAIKRQALLSALGPQVDLLSQWLPLFQRFTGNTDTRPEPQSLHVMDPHLEARFLTGVRDFLAFFATQEHPLIVCLEDLQWADSASLKLLEFLITDKKLCFMLLVGTYDRSNNQASEVESMISRCSRQSKSPVCVAIKPLSQESVLAFLEDCLFPAPGNLAELSKIFSQKFGANPLVMKELLRHLYRQGQLSYDVATKCWTWDRGSLERFADDSTLADLFEIHLSELDPAMQRLLSHASVIGSHFELSCLATVCQTGQAELEQQLALAERTGLVLQTTCPETLADSTGTSPCPAGQTWYQFRHEQIYQAAYRCIASADTPRLHLEVARTLSARSADPYEDTLWHYQQATSLITEPQERGQVAARCAEHAAHALAILAFQKAYNYLEMARQLLGKQPFLSAYALAVTIHKHSAEAAYRLWNPDMGDGFCQILSENVRTDVERAQVRMFQMAQHTRLGNPDKAFTLGLQALALLGIRCETSPIKQAWRAFLGKTAPRRPDLESLTSRERVSDPRLLVILELLAQLVGSVETCEQPELQTRLLLLAVKAVKDYGPSPWAGGILMTYARWMPPDADGLVSSQELAQWALALEEQRDLPANHGRLLFDYACAVRPWQHHWKTLSSYFKQSVEASLASADLDQLRRGCALVHHFDPTMDLETSLREGEKYLELLERFHPKGRTPETQLFTQYRKALMGATQDLSSFSGGSFREEEGLHRLEATKDLVSLAFWWTLKLELAYTQGAFESAASMIPTCAGLLPAVKGYPVLVDFHFFAFLTRAQLVGEGVYGSDRAHRKAMKAHLKQMQVWMRHHPTNFEHRYLIMLAEWDRLNQKPWRAINRFRDAIQKALQHEQPRHAALACELAGSFFLKQQQPRVAAAYFLDAERGYQHWGATAKVTLLGQDYGQILNLLRLPEHTAGREDEDIFSSSGPSPARTLDLDTVIKTSMVIASEIDYDQLLAKMMNITIESAGAQMGALISFEGESLFVEATSRLSEESLTGMKSTPLEQADFLSQKLVRYTFRSGKTAVMGNAAMDPIFGKDPYLAQGKVKSVLCTPIRHKDQVVGVLYLENNLVEDAFNEERVALLQMLTAQAAISLENARLFAQSKRNERAVRQLNQDLANLNEALEQRVTERTTQLHTVQTELVAKAHHAGMAEIATSVLHNVGNILNSVITSCQLINETVTNSKLDGMLMANQMLREKMEDIENFILHDPKGMNLLKYYLQLDKYLLKERETVIGNVTRLMGKVESIREVIMAQQSYASGGFQDELSDLKVLVEETLSIMGNSIDRHEIIVVQEYEPVNSLLLPKNKVIHLMVNLVKNAIESLSNVPTASRKLILRMEAGLDDVQLEFTDTGIGIRAENVEKIFQHGFTTKSHGHGFGLHSCAATMAEIGGTICVKSDGEGLGATFTLSFPVWRMVVKPSDP